MKKLCISFFLAYSLTTVLFANDLVGKSTGEYLLTTEREVKREDLEIFSNVTEIKTIGPHLYLLKFRNDPGLEELQKKIQKTKWKIQPNFIYRSSKSKLKK